MPLPSGLSIGWNGNWQNAYIAGSGGVGINFTDSNIINPFIEAYNERAKTLNLYKSNLSSLSFTNEHFWASCNNPSSGYPCAQIAPAASTLEGLFNKISVSMPNGNILIASGVSWPQLQTDIINLSQYFIQAYDQYGNDIDYDGTPSFHPSGIYTNGFSDQPHMFEYDTVVGFPSGLFSCSSSTLPWLYPFNSISGLVTLGSSSFLNTFLKTFPEPSGFTRKFPREIWAMGCSGDVGQVARFTARNPYVSGLLVTFFGGSGWNYYWGPDTPQSYGVIGTLIGTESSLPSTNPLWYGDPPNASGFNQVVITPTCDIPRSGGIYQYISPSGWTELPNSTLQPDTRTEYGEICPGDYMGWWILDNLRDALNQMVWTIGGSIPDIGINSVRYSIPYVCDTNFSFSVYPDFHDFTGTSQNNTKIWAVSGSTGTLTGGNYNFPRADSTYNTGQGPTRAYCYLKPSGVNTASSGMLREYDFYSVTESSTGPFSVPTYPEPGPVPAANYFGDLGKFAPASGTTQTNSDWGFTNYLTYLGNTTATFIGSGNVGIIAGDTSLTEPSPPNSLGYYTSAVVCLAKWDQPSGGFAYSKWT